MKLLIDIEEETYINAKSLGLFLCPRDKNELEKAIKFAIPYEERPQGEWINMLYHPFGHYLARCNNCNVMITTSHISFCPNCGADMRGEENAKT